MPPTSRSNKLPLTAAHAPASATVSRRADERNPLVGHRPSASDLHLHDQGYFRKRIRKGQAALDGDGDVFKLRILEDDEHKNHVLKNQQHTLRVTKEELEESFDKSSERDFDAQENAREDAARAQQP